MSRPHFVLSLTLGLFSAFIESNTCNYAKTFSSSRFYFRLAGQNNCILCVTDRKLFQITITPQTLFWQASCVWNKFWFDIVNFLVIIHIKYINNWVLLWIHWCFTTLCKYLCIPSHAKNNGLESLLNICTILYFWYWYTFSTVEDRLILQQRACYSANHFVCNLCFYTKQGLEVWKVFGLVSVSFSDDRFEWLE